MGVFVVILLWKWWIFVVKMGDFGVKIRGKPYMSC